jgi:hypothetical protein
VLLETFAWPHSRQLVASATVSLSSRVQAVELLLVELLLVELLLVGLPQVTLLQVSSLKSKISFYILTDVTGNAGKAAGNGNAKANGGAAAGNGNKKNNRAVAGTRLARFVVVDQD